MIFKKWDEFNKEMDGIPRVILRVTIGCISFFIFVIGLGGGCSDAGVECYASREEPDRCIKIQLAGCRYESFYDFNPGRVLMCELHRKRFK